jgi:two-component system cell cycle response regulator
MPKILIVDDEPDVLGLFRMILTKAGMDVTTAKDASNCIEMLDYEHPDLILLDVVMPGMDGYKLCKKIKTDPTTTNIPVVLFTVLNSEMGKALAEEAGADGFLNKPLTSNDRTIFLSMLDDLLYNKFKLNH